MIVADNASIDGARELADGWGGNVRLLGFDENIGVAARNRAVEAAHGELILMLDDDSYPQAGAAERLVQAICGDPTLGVAGGRVIDVDLDGTQLDDGTAPGSFDWFFTPRDGPPRASTGVEACFFAQCACVVRRRAFLEVGGCFEPYFFYGEELDLTARLVAAGWKVAYFPNAAFEHRRGRPGGRTSPAIKRMLRYRIRNQIWYFWLRFPLPMALRRIPAYLAYDLVECAYRREMGEWVSAVSAAWADRAAIRGERQPLTRPALRRAERDRGRRHVRLLALMVRSRMLSKARYS